MYSLGLGLFLVLLCARAGAQEAASPQPNLIFILSDDHRYDAMGFTHRFAGLETPHLDEMARDGRHFANAFVSTSLCSPSRATILTGQYAHEHRVVDNSSPSDPTLRFFPSELQEAGYRTAFVGKWHMGDEADDPRPGFDHWVSFRGQGTYYAPNLNIDGERHQYPDTAYTTDLLTELALDWADGQDDAPYFVYLSHKAVHAEFNPAQRHLGSYAEVPVSYPPTMWPPSEAALEATRALNGGKDPVTAPPTPDSAFAKATAAGYDYAAVPDWVKAQRYSWHGVDFMYNGQIRFDSFYVAYLETLRAVDESVGRVLAFAKAEIAAGRPTVVVYMGDNGFSFGEHGLIDKRQAYEESMRVPLLAWGPGIVSPGTTEALAQNTDIAPTMLALAGAPIPNYYRGASLVPLFDGSAAPATWRARVPYEYYWEQAFPQTPTTHAIRGDRYKFVRYHGVWDTNEFYDLQADPNEARNLIAEPSLQDTIGVYNRALWEWLGSTDGAAMPIKPTPRRPGVDYRYGDTY